jgi:hypothetical protein
MPYEPMSAKDFFAKVESEGGTLNALDYGLKYTDLNPDDPEGTNLRTAWQALEDKYQQLRPFLRQVDDLLDDFDTDQEGH